MLRDNRFPKRVARVVQVQGICAKEFRARASIGIEHRREHFDEVEVLVIRCVF